MQQDLKLEPCGDHTLVSGRKTYDIKDYLLEMDGAWVKALKSWFVPNLKPEQVLLKLKTRTEEDQDEPGQEQEEMGDDNDQESKSIAVKLSDLKLQRPVTLVPAAQSKSKLSPHHS